MIFDGTNYMKKSDYYYSIGLKYILEFPRMVHLFKKRYNSNLINKDSLESFEPRYEDHATY